MIEDIFRKKSLKKALAKNKKCEVLNRSLGPTGLILLGIGAILGAGIFVIAGVASVNTGPALIISFALAAVICVFAALCYAEVSALIPIAGSLYTYAYMTMGEIWAWLMGWIMMAQYLIIAAVVAIGWSSYVIGFLTSFGICLPTALIGPPGINGGIINLPAVMVVIFLTTVLAMGMKECCQINALMVFIKIGAVFLFILVGLTFINPLNYIPFAPFGTNGIAIGVAMVFFAYNGFDTVAQAAEETKNPGKSLPIGIIGSLGICAILYILVAVVMMGMVPFNLLNTASPIGFALQYVGAKWAFAILSIGAIAGLTSVTLVNLYTNSRTLFAISRDGLLPPIFSNISSKSQVPLFSTLFIGVIAIIFAGFFSLSSIFEIVNLVMLISFIVIAITVLLLRKQHPQMERPFKCPLVPIIPVILILLSLILILHLNLYLVYTFLLWTLVGGIVYFLFKKYHGKSGKKRNIFKKKKLYEAT